MAGGGDMAQIVEQARDLVDVLQGLEELRDGPGALRPISHVVLNDHQVRLICSLVPLTLVQKTESTVYRPGGAAVLRRAGPVAGVHREGAG